MKKSLPSPRRSTVLKAVATALAATSVSGCSAMGGMAGGAVGGIGSLLSLALYLAAAAAPIALSYYLYQKQND